MLTEKQILEIREHLERAQNPVFFFDNDADGLCSFLLLRRYLGRGKGVAMKSADSSSYFRKVQELGADYIFILDKPVVSLEFFEKVRQVNLPVVWIDHHEGGVVPDFVSYYNPLFNEGKTNEPVTELCYRIAGRKEDLWIAVAGCVSDHFIPDYYAEFMGKYSDLGMESGNVKEIYYSSPIGKIGRLFNAGLKDRTTNVVKMLRFLIGAETPYEVLEESRFNREMYGRFNEINDRCEKLLERVEEKGERVLFLEYGGEMSISAELADRVRFGFPKKIVVVIYAQNSKVNISIRGENVREVVLELIKGFEGATGGGHEKAVGVRVRREDLDEFKKRFVEIVENRNI